MTLAAALSAEGSEVFATPQVVPAPRKGTLLIVDDEDGPRQSLRFIFKDDYQVLMASDVSWCFPRLDAAFGGIVGCSC